MPDQDTVIFYSLGILLFSVLCIVAERVRMWGDSE